MSRFLKVAASLIAFSSLTACTVIPPQVAYTGPSVGIVTVGPAPYYRGSGRYHASPPHGHGYGHGHGHGYGDGHRHW